MSRMPSRSIIEFQQGVANTLCSIARGHAICGVAIVFAIEKYETDEGLPSTDSVLARSCCEHSFPLIARLGDDIVDGHIASKRNSYLRACNNAIADMLESKSSIENGKIYLTDKYYLLISIETGDGGKNDFIFHDYVKKSGWKWKQ